MPIQRRSCDEIVRRETEYRESLRKDPVAGEIDLF
jgi:hypothetical protein